MDQATHAAEARRHEELLVQEQPEWWLTAAAKAG